MPLLNIVSHATHEGNTEAAKGTNKQIVNKFLWSATSSGSVKLQFHPDRLHIMSAKL